MNPTVCFLSHLSGDEVSYEVGLVDDLFLSHLSGDEEDQEETQNCACFLSHLSGDEVKHYVAELRSYVSKSPER